MSRIVSEGRCPIVIQAAPCGSARQGKGLGARAEYGDWLECDSCAWAGTDACDECEDADLYEPEEEAAAA